MAREVAALHAETAVHPRPRLVPRGGAGLTLGLIRAARPRQWVKNLLVFAAPGAAGLLHEAPTFGRAAVAFVAFCLVASGTYLLNDARDAESDRLHPIKRDRPIANGTVPPGVAQAVAAVLVLASLALSAALGWRFLLLPLTYIVLTTSYTLWFKRIVVVDLVVVAAGFIVRAVAGGVATNVRVSGWFLIVTSFASLFIVAGKRHSEHVGLGTERGSTRAALADYRLSFLRYVWAASSGVAIVAYCLWATDEGGRNLGIPWFELSIVPFVLGILRYAFLLERGEGGAPEDLILGDRKMQIAGLVWVIVFACGVYTR